MLVNYQINSFLFLTSATWFLYKHLISSSLQEQLWQFIGGIQESDPIPLYRLARQLRPWRCDITDTIQEPGQERHDVIRRTNSCSLQVLIVIKIENEYITHYHNFSAKCSLFGLTSTVVRLILGKHIYFYSLISCYM